uniref:Uncharacterized protein n=1 Tax=Globodera rostochiensis TaxID=31243 RepID=A0A914HZS1_GLORO
MHPTFSKRFLSHCTKAIRLMYWQSAHKLTAARAGACIKRRQGLTDFPPLPNRFRFSSSHRPLCSSSCPKIRN